MIVLGIDPGPETCGVVLYDAHDRMVIESDSAASVEHAVQSARMWLSRSVVAIERVQSTGQAGRSLLETSEVVGRIWQAALGGGGRVVLLYRREVLAALDVTGKGNRDALVRQRMIEAHPGGTGTKKAPGPLYGVSGHAWQALAVAYVAAQREA